MWGPHVSTTLLSISNNRSHICHALSFQKHLLIICARRAKRASAQYHHLQFNAFAFYVTAWKYKRLTHWQATDKRSISRKSTSQRASRASELGNFSHENSYIFQCLSWYLKLIWHVSRFNTLLHLFIQCSFPFTHDMYYKRLTSYRHNTHIEIIYSMRARKIYALLHFKPAI